MSIPTPDQPALALIAPSALSLDADVSPASMALMALLRERKSSRDFSPRELPLYTLSRLLWSAFGVNRSEPPGGRTAPSAGNAHAIDVYVAMAGGLYFFDAPALQLQPVLGEDLRAATGAQDCAASAPVDLIFVADLERLADVAPDEQALYAGLDTGYISQNVYLFCAAEGLATVARGWLDRAALAARMGLGPRQRVILAQSVGYPLVAPPPSELASGGNGANGD